MGWGGVGWGGVGWWGGFRVCHGCACTAQIGLRVHSLKGLGVPTLLFGDFEGFWGMCFGVCTTLPRA